MKCEIFAENNSGIQQDDINEWLDDHNDIEIVKILQTSKANSSWIWTTIFYKEKKEVRKDKLERLDFE